MGENGISLLGITGHVIIEVRWSVRWRGYDRTGHKKLENSMILSRKTL
jgi:hypothetical protein